MITKMATDWIHCDCLASVLAGWTNQIGPKALARAARIILQGSPRSSTGILLELRWPMHGCLWQIFLDHAYYPLLSLLHIVTTLAWFPVPAMALLWSELQDHTWQCWRLANGHELKRRENFLRLHKKIKTPFCQVQASKGTIYKSYSISIIVDTLFPLEQHSTDFFCHML